MSDANTATIVGIGSYAPVRVLTNTEMERIVETSDEWIRSRTGIEERHIAAANEATSDMAAKAAESALRDAGLSAADVELIIVATITPDRMFPATACVVQEKLGAKNAAAFDLSAACAGFVYALTVGTQFVASGFYKTVLVIGAEKLSAFVNWKDRGTCVLMGDGAGAVLLRASTGGSGVIKSILAADGSGADLLQMPGGGSRMPASAETVQKELHYLQMNGKEVFKVAVKTLAESIQKVLSQAGFGLSDVTWIFPHQANIRILDAVAERLGFPKEKIYLNIQKFGNTSAASIPLALDEAYRRGKLRKGDLLVFSGIGSGLVWGACLFRWDKPFPGEQS